MPQLPPQHFWRHVRGQAGERLPGLPPQHKDWGRAAQHGRFRVRVRGPLLLPQAPDKHKRRWRHVHALPLGGALHRRNHPKQRKHHPRRRSRALHLQGRGGSGGGLEVPHHRELGARQLDRRVDPLELPPRPPDDQRAGVRPLPDVRGGQRPVVPHGAVHRRPQHAHVPELPHWGRVQRGLPAHHQRAQQHRRRVGGRRGGEVPAAKVPRGLQAGQHVG
mmetsp:Transcript_35046/g.89548  ORF Transcript_35046/g.89548 Transcript_35046/m.89548 type:complete len:219 (-) Transcript_35046:1217-1873(-)